MTLTTAQRDRACGVLLASAAGDALGAPYEFQPPRGPELPVEMVGGAGWEPGEWTDDTSMAIAIGEVAAKGVDLCSEAAQDTIVARWCEWAKNAKDVGNLTRAVLSAAEATARQDGTGVGARHARAAAQREHQRTGRSGGNGSLMRTGPVALAYLDEGGEDGLVRAATAISSLTHFDPEAGEACVLWCLAIRHAVLTGDLDVRRGLGHLAATRRAVWAARIEEAEARRPADFRHNGWVVAAFQAAWSAITSTPIPTEDATAGVFRAGHLRLALDAAVRGGRDTDTVAAIAGALLGGVYGASAVPAVWRRPLHGWPARSGRDTHARDLVAMATSITQHTEADEFDYTYSHFGQLDALAKHPYDDGLWLGGIDALRSLPTGVDAVVSLCRIGPDDVESSAAGNVELIEVRLIDRRGVQENPNLGFVLDDTVSVIEQLRRERHSVLLHCVQAQSRTPAVAALYGARLRGVSVDTALVDVHAVLPNADPNDGFRAALRATQTR